MKPLLFLLLTAALGLADTSTVAPKKADSTRALTQEEVGMRIIYEILYGDTASTAKYFEDSVGPNLTRQVLETIQSQISWLPKMIGDNLEQLMAGPQYDSAGTVRAYFREYRMANESNKRAPLIVMHIWFRDSMVTRAAGAFAKTFLDSDKRLAGQEVWKTKDDSIEVHSVTLVEFKEGLLPAISVYDGDTAAIDRNSALKKAVPIVREAIARGILKQAGKELKEGQKLMDNVGVSFIRKDPRMGFTHYKFAVGPKEYMDPEDLAKVEARGKAKAETKSGPQPKSRKKSK